MRHIFLLAPALILVLALLSWTFIPFDTKVSAIQPMSGIGGHVFFFIVYALLASSSIILPLDIAGFDLLFTTHTAVGILALLALSSLNVYGIVISG